MRSQRTSLGWFLLGCLVVSGSACAAGTKSGATESTSSSSGDVTSGGGSQSTSTGEGGEGGKSGVTTSTGEGGAATTSSSTGSQGSTSTSSSSSSSGGGGASTSSSTASSSSASTSGSGGAPPVGGAVDWSRAYGDIDPSQGVFHDHSVQGIGTDSAGNVYITGSFQTSMDFGAAGQLVRTPGGTTDTFLAKVSAAGTPIWAKNFGGNNSSQSAAVGLVVDAQNNVTIVGSVAGSISFGASTFTATPNASDIYVASFDSNGVYRYSKGFPGAGGSSAFAAAVAPNGDVAFTGSLNGAVTFGGNNLSALGPTDIFVVRLDSLGNHIMSKRFGDSDMQAGTSIAFTPTGEIVLAAYAAGTTDFGGGPLVATGSSCSTAVAKLNGTTGAHIWSRLYDHGTTKDCTFRRVAVDASGNVFVTTSTGGDQTFQVNYGGGVLTGAFFVVKLSPAGNHVWSKGWSSPRGVYALATDAPGNILITGLLRTPIDFGTGVLTPFDGWDGFIAKLDPQGNALWSRIVTDSNQQSNSQWGLAITADTAGNVLTAGRLAGATNFGDGEIIGEKGFSSGNDVYLAKLAP